MVDRSYVHGSGKKHSVKERQLLTVDPCKKMAYILLEAKQKSKAMLRLTSSGTRSESLGEASVNGYVRSPVS